jgi:hypothetical protein
MEGTRAATRLDPSRAWTVLGIDPGEQGAVALILARPGCDRPRLGELVDASNRAAWWQLIPEADLVVIEGQQASPQMGVSSAFRLGQAYGRLLEAVEAGARGEAVIAYPTGWRGSYGLPGGEKGKVAGIALAEQLLEGSRRAVRRHDQADAVLLAWWGWRKHLLARAMQELQAAGES